MAHPTDRDSDAPRSGPHVEEPAPPLPTPPPLPRELDASRPLIVLLIVSMLLVVGVAYYAIEQSGLAGNVMGQPMSFGDDEPVMDLDEILQEHEKRNLLGRDVALWRVPVERVVGNYTFWVGSDATRRVPVVLLGELTSRQQEAETAVQPGDTLAVFGTIRAVREVRHLDEAWAMDEEEWERVQQAVIYVSAIRVEHLARSDAAGRPPR